MIRHNEVGRVPIERSEDIDYLFHRLFALMRLLLHATGTEADTRHISIPGPEDGPVDGHHNGYRPLPFSMLGLMLVLTRRVTGG